MINLFTDDYFMKEALKEAKRAFEQDEVPVGAVIVSHDKIIASSVIFLKADHLDMYLFVSYPAVEVRRDA